jgi:hypothetical protein
MQYCRLTQISRLKLIVIGFILTVAIIPQIEFVNAQLQFSTYDNLGISFQYPSDWQEMPGEPAFSVFLGSPSSGASFGVKISDVSEETSLEEAFNIIYNNMATTNPNFQVLN